MPLTTAPLQTHCCSHINRDVSQFRCRNLQMLPRQQHNLPFRQKYWQRQFDLSSSSRGTVKCCTTRQSAAAAATTSSVAYPSPSAAAAAVLEVLFVPDPVSLPSSEANASTTNADPTVLDQHRQQCSMASHKFLTTWCSTYLQGSER